MLRIPVSTVLPTLVTGALKWSTELHVMPPLATGFRYPFLPLEPRKFPSRPTRYPFISSPFSGNLAVSPPHSLVTREGDRVPPLYIIHPTHALHASDLCQHPLQLRIVPFFSRLPSSFPPRDADLFLCTLFPALSAGAFPSCTGQRTRIQDHRIPIDNLFDPFFFSLSSFAGDFKLFGSLFALSFDLSSPAPRLFLFFRVRRLSRLLGPPRFRPPASWFRPPSSVTAVASQATSTVLLFTFFLRFPTPLF